MGFIFVASGRTSRLFSFASVDTIVFESAEMTEGICYSICRIRTDVIEGLGEGHG